MYTLSLPYKRILRTFPFLPRSLWPGGRFGAAEVHLEQGTPFRSALDG